jgi:hypothetical protein
MAIKCKTQSLVIEYDKKLWPCCYVANTHYDSEYLKNLPNDWNDLSVHSVKEILNHHAFTKHFNTEDWQSDRCDVICNKECSQ